MSGPVGACLVCFLLGFIISSETLICYDIQDLHGSVNVDCGLLDYGTM